MCACEGGGDGGGGGVSWERCGGRRGASVEGWLYRAFRGTVPCEEEGGTESRVVGNPLTWLVEEQGAGQIVQQLHNPMFFQVIPGFTLSGAISLHSLASGRC